MKDWSVGAMDTSARWMTTARVLIFCILSSLFYFFSVCVSCVSFLPLCASWHENPDVRPGFEKILERLSKLREEASDDDNPITGAPSASRATH